MVVAMPARLRSQIIEDDMYGRYTFDELDDEFDLRNFAPSRGKDGRRRKSDAGL
jgi:hypothetical protein